MKGLFISDCDTLESVISVRLAAIWLAWDSIEEQAVYESDSLSCKQDKDWQHMMDFSEEKPVVSPYLYDTIELPCAWWKEEADKYLKALKISIDQGHIKPKQIRRNFPDCKLDLDRTFLGRGEVESFLSLFGRGAGEVFYKSIDSLDQRLAEVVTDFYNRVRSPIDLEEARLKAANMGKEAVVNLIAENMQLKEKLSSCKDQEETENPRKSALLLIARALELYLDSRSNNNQARYVSDLLEGENSRMLSERTINGLLAQAKKELVNARKS
ncbi:MAG TPA: hypothetical protein VJY83_03125 [Thiopseudomonas sp.]|nr:hypothetical protein [Thiopseudomonas sp.]